MQRLPPVVEVALVALVLAAAATDLRSRRIPNPLSVAGLLAAFGLHVWLEGWSGLRFALLGAGLGFLVFLPPFLLRGGGAGDVKLMTAVGALAGWQGAFVIFLLTAVSGGVLALALLLWGGGFGRALRNIGRIVGALLQGKAPHRKHPDLTIEGKGAVTLPYAVPIAIGTLAFLALAA